MSKVKVKIDHAAVGALLQGAEVRDMVNGYAYSVASMARGRIPGGYPDAAVEVDEYTTDRAAAAVVLKDIRGVGLEAKHGVLRGVAAAGGGQFRARRKR